MFHYRLTISYQGTGYLGWQIQPEHFGKTIQGELNACLKKIAKSDDIKSLGAGRTDAGVHALGQVVKVSIPLEIDPGSLLRALNSHLPKNIRVLAVALSDNEFIPTVHAVSKEYHYRFSTELIHPPFVKDLIAHFPHELDIELMQKACQVFCGTHDFSNYYCEGTPVSSYVREIYECEILKIARSEILPPYYVFRVVGNGFLKQMVRLMVGTVWNVGRGRVSLEMIKKSLIEGKGEKLGSVAPGHGLYMHSVNYSSRPFEVTL